MILCLQVLKLIENTVNIEITLYTLDKLCTFQVASKATDVQCYQPLFADMCTFLHNHWEPLLRTDYSGDSEIGCGFHMKTKYFYVRLLPVYAGNIYKIFSVVMSGINLTKTSDVRCLNVMSGWYQLNTNIRCLDIYYLAIYESWKIS